MENACYSDTDTDNPLILNLKSQSTREEAMYSGESGKVSDVRLNEHMGN